MGVLKYAILGLLYQRPRSGYEMAQEFQDTLNEFTERQAQPDLPRAEEDDRRRAGGVPGGGRGYVAREEALLHHAQGARGVHEVDGHGPGAPTHAQERAQAAGVLLGLACRRRGASRC